MKLLLPKADYPQPAFLEADGDLRAQRVPRCESISRNPAPHPFRVVLADQQSQIQPSKRCLRPGNQTQEMIQYP